VTGPSDASPKVSVVIPCYNQARYLPDAVASVAAQTFDDWEIVIVDDGSPDETSVVAAGLIARYAPSRIRLVRQANGGVARARNAGIAAAAGRYILPFDADDRLHPELLAETVRVLDAEPDVGVAYTDFQFFGASDEVRVRPEYDLERLCEFNLLANSALFRRDAWLETGGYDPKLAGLEDWDFWLSCAEHGFRGRRVPRVLFFYRRHAGSRNDAATTRRSELVRQIRANHPALFTPRQRLRRWARRTARRLLSLVRPWRRRRAAGPTDQPRRS
jgi:glycosyltransferase involved in cell wall biosynthesis